MRYPFNSVFQENLDGSITPKISVSINGLGMGPGVSFGQGVAFGGVDLHRYRGMDVEGEEQGGSVLVIKGFYQPQVGGISGTISLS